MGYNSLLLHIGQGGGGYVRHCPYVLLNLNGIRLHITTLWSFMDRKVYLMELRTSLNHILVKPSQWSCEQPLEISGLLVQAHYTDYCKDT